MNKSNKKVKFKTVSSEIKRANTALGYFDITVKHSLTGKLKVRLGKNKWEYYGLHCTPLMTYRIVLEIALSMLSAEKRRCELAIDHLSTQLGR